MQRDGGIESRSRSRSSGGGRSEVKAQSSASRAQGSDDSGHRCRCFRRMLASVHHHHHHHHHSHHHRFISKLENFQISNKNRTKLLAPVLYLVPYLDYILDRAIYVLCWTLNDMLPLSGPIPLSSYGNSLPADCLLALFNCLSVLVHLHVMYIHENFYSTF